METGGKRFFSGWNVINRSQWIAYLASINRNAIEFHVFLYSIKKHVVILDGSGVVIKTKS